MILLIDNYDSFVHNLARHFRRLGAATEVVRNDRITAADVERLGPQAVVLSPGPCTPKEAGCSVDVVRSLFERIPILGICLGHQAIVAARGGAIVRSPPAHGRSSLVDHDGRGVFRGLSSPLTVGRYHSLAADEPQLPEELEVSARCCDDATVMAVRHRQFPVVGIQFHPESVLTPEGYAILANFLELAGLPRPSTLPQIDDERPPEPEPPTDETRALHF